jgi:hypothetical protein
MNEFSLMDVAINYVCRNKNSAELRLNKASTSSAQFSFWAKLFDISSASVS